MTRWLILVALAVSFVGCGPKTVTTGTPAPPEPPQVQVLRLDRALADATNVAAKTVATLYAGGKVDIVTAQQTKQYLTAVTTASDAIAAECKSSDPWPTARAKIVSTLASLAISVSPVDPDLKAELASVQNLINQILGVK